MLTQQKQYSQVVRTPKTWDKATSQAEIDDYFHIPYTPVMQVVEKDILENGRVWLRVKPMSSSYSEEWVVEPEPAEQPHLAQVDRTAAQLAGFAGDSTSCQLRPNWEAMEEFKHGRAHGLADALEKLEPICTEASCPYSTGYLEGYNSVLAPQPQPEVVKPPQWTATYNFDFDCYWVCVGNCGVGRADTYEEAEQIAQKAFAANKFWQEHREKVLAAYAD